MVDLGKAEKHLVWYWQEREAALGHHGQSFDPPTTGGKVDSHHDAMVAFGHRDAVEREEAIARVLAHVPGQIRADLDAALTPRPWSGPIRAAFKRGERLCLAGLALRLPEAAQAQQRWLEVETARYEKDLAKWEASSPKVQEQKKRPEPPRVTSLIDWLGWEASANHRTVLEPIRTATTTRYLAGVRAFADVYEGTDPS